MTSEIRTPETSKKRAGYGILGTVVIIIVVLVVLGFLFR
jgi:hypothetical protein